MEEQNPSNCDVQLPNFETKTTHNKRRKLLQIASDRISDLPEELLIRILSSLNTKDAVKTGILSKRWENLWTNVDHLVYSFKWVYEKRTRLLQLEKFISFVDRTLVLNTHNHIENFSLYVGSREFRDAAQVTDKWLQCIFKKNVKIFKFSIMGLEYSPPKWFYHSSSFVELCIRDWKISIPGQDAVSWTSLKYLTLSDVKFDNCQIGKMLLGCPVIETLFLYNVRGIEVLDIVSPSLRKLTVIHCGFVHDLVAINAPLVQELEIDATFARDMPTLCDMFSLTNAELDLRRLHLFEIDDSLLVKACKLLEYIRHVEELKVGQLFIQALSMTKHLGLLSHSFKCKLLTISLCISKYELFGIARLLQSVPNLETLVMEVEDFEEWNFGKYFDGICDVKENKFLSTQMEDFPYLRTIDFESQSSDKKVFDCEILAYILTYILRHACVKEKLIIRWKRYASSSSVEYASLLAQKLKANLKFDGGFEYRQKESDFEFKFCN